MGDNITSEEIYAALGVAAPQPGAQEPESADPELDLGEQEPEPADPAQAPEATEPEAAPEAKPADEKKPLTAEERQANAARRRQAETQAAIDAAVAAAKEQAEAERQEAIDAAFKAVGYASEADFKAKQAAKQAEARAKALTRLGLDEESAAALGWGQTPEAAIEVAAVDKPAADNDPFEGGAETLPLQLAEIAKLDPSVKSLDDLRAKPFATAMAQALNARQFGTDAGRLVRAFRFFAHDDIVAAEVAKATAQAKAAGKQAALNSAAGTAHLAPLPAMAGEAPLEVPSATMEAYRALHPQWTDKQIKDDYNMRAKRA